MVWTVWQAVDCVAAAAAWSQNQLGKQPLAESGALIFQSCDKLIFLKKKFDHVIINFAILQFGITICLYTCWNWKIWHYIENWNIPWLYFSIFGTKIPNLLRSSSHVPPVIFSTKPPMAAPCSSATAGRSTAVQILKNFHINLFSFHMNRVRISAV